MTYNQSNNYECNIFKKQDQMENMSNVTFSPKSETFIDILNLQKFGIEFNY